jgi:hypothetical protein
MGRRAAPSHGLSGWFSQTQPESSQTMHFIRSRPTALDRWFRQRLFGVSAHLPRATLCRGNGHPSFQARVRTGSWPRFNAAAARIKDAPWATKAFSRSSSSVDHGLANRGISLAEVHRTNRNEGRADPNEDGRSLFGNDWCRFHDPITAMGSIGSDRAGPAIPTYGPVLKRNGPEEELRPPVS